MRTVLLISLIAISLCLGEYEKRSFNENDMKIDRAFKEAAKNYLGEDSKQTVDDLQPVSVYSQLVNGMNYKVCFINLKENNQIIQEYVINNPASSNEFSVVENKKLQQTGGLISFNDANFSKIESALKKYLKGTVDELNYLSYAYPIENNEAIYYVAGVFTKKGEEVYIIPFDKKGNDFDSPCKIK